MPNEHLIGEFKSLYLLEDIKITGNQGERKLICFCGKQFNRSLVSHIKEDHPEVWEEWQRVFVKLRNLGYSSKKIIEGFKADGRFLFSWTVVEKELTEIFEEDPSSMEISQKGVIKDWEPLRFTLEETTLWSFPQRGTWAVHTNDYRGNWPPQLVRNLILKYTQPGDRILDLFAGGGTTLIECWLLNRRSLGIDISPISEKIVKSRLREMQDKSKSSNQISLEKDYSPVFVRNDSRNALSVLTMNGWSIGSIKLVCAHPPYYNALRYSRDIPGELSAKNSLDEFLSELRLILEKGKISLIDGGFLAILIGDLRKNGELFPLGSFAVNMIRELKMTLKEIIVKAQHHDSTTNLYKGHKGLDYRIAHEYLIVAQK